MTSFHQLQFSNCTSVPEDFFLFCWDVSFPSFCVYTKYVCKCNSQGSNISSGGKLSLCEDWFELRCMHMPTFTLSAHRREAMAQLYSALFEFKRSLVQASAKALYCVLEQDTLLPNGLVLLKPRNVSHTWLKNCWLGCKASTKRIHQQ